jgi:hypothetical protein
MAFLCWSDLNFNLKLKKKKKKVNSIMADLSVKLNDGRNIGYGIFGRENSKNVILFIPGLPGTRRFCGPIEHDVDIGVIVLERPGIGISSGPVSES